MCQHFLLKYALQFKSKMQKLQWSHLDLSYVPVVENGTLKEKWKQNKSVTKESYVSSVVKSLKLEFPLLEKLQLSLMAKQRVDVQCQMYTDTEK